LSASAVSGVRATVALLPTSEAAAAVVAVVAVVAAVAVVAVVVFEELLLPQATSPRLRRSETVHMGPADLDTNLGINTLLKVRTLEV
jgi:hypothetical protein